MANLNHETLMADVAKQFCSGHAPYLASPDHCDKEEQRVIRQFVEAMLYENIVQYQSDPRALFSNEFSEFESVYDSVYTFEQSKHIFRCLGACRVFERIRLAEGSIQVWDEDSFREARILDIVCSLNTDDKAKLRLLGELMQTIALCRWNTQNLTHHKTPRRQLSFGDLESAITEGHLYHPSFKARTGFTLQDHIDYGPEAARAFQFSWLAVKTELVDRAFPTDEQAFWKQELGEDAYAELIQRMQQKGVSWQTHSLMPIHPWQVGAIQNRGLAKAIADGDMIELGSAGDFYQATQSLRTLVNVTHPEKANVKVPLNLVSTSSHRNLQDHFVCTAPVISTWLQQVVENDGYLKKKNNLLLLSEYAGLLFKPTDSEQAKAMDGLVGAIFRESVVDKLEAGEAAIPFTALMLVESDNRPFIADWLDQYGVEAWVDRLLDVMMVPIWHMLVHNGVAFEAHCQNLILTHKNGWPERIVLRDFHEDMEYVESYLKKPDHTPDLVEADPYFKTIPLDEGFSMSDIDELRELYMDTVYILNLADLSFLLERFYGFAETQFWQQVRQHLSDYQASGVTSAQRIDEMGADRKEIIVESLLKKKILNGGTLDYFEHTISNPLCADVSTKPAEQKEAIAI